MPIPAANPIVRAEVNAASGPQVKQPKTPITPITLVTREGLASLHEIIKRDAQALDEMSKQRLHRQVQKLASATQTSLTERIILEDQNRFSCKMNNEA